jgi:DNA invertase Pin-like site-specific DNA recombinase
MAKRPPIGRGLFYTRDSGGKHDNTPGEYVRWAQGEAEKLGVAFTGTPAQIEAMIRDRRPYDGNLYFDYGVSGNKLTRAALDALIQAAMTDETVSHVFIPRRDRLARPDDPIDAVKIENLLRQAGLTLVFMDRTVHPLTRGRRDIGELIHAMLDYNYAGEFRHELAQKILRAQLTLARAGFSVGGRAPYGFRRWLAGADGTAVRQLADGEYVRMAGHHVVWLPGPDEELAVIQRILSMLETIPASRVAATLTAEGVPSPDAGRQRTDRGARHATSGVWHQTTITNIARNPLLQGLMTYGRRSMGDQLRFAPEGPRSLNEEDLRNDGKPKVVVNPDSERIISSARFEPVVDRVRHLQLLGTLEQRSGSQRGKPRSRTPGQNPLGSRIFDMDCGWPMYRQPYNRSFRYLCALYQQSHGAECRHNHVDGVSATKFLLTCIRQRVLSPAIRTKLEQKIRVLAERERGESRPGVTIAALQAELGELRRKRERISQNLALAETVEQHQAVAAVFDTVLKEEKALEAKVRQAEEAAGAPHDLEEEISAAMAGLDRMAELAADSTNLESVGELFTRLNARLFLHFEEIQSKKRKVNKVSGGMVTFGASPPPVALYEGPTGRRALLGRASTPDCMSGVTVLPAELWGTAREGDSLGKVNRGERI